MERTRESITEKVAALENQVIGTVHQATESVNHTVEAVREAVASAPTAVRDTLREVTQSVKEAIHSFSTRECIRSFPAAALGTSMAAGFLTGYFFGGRRMPRQTAMPLYHDGMPTQTASSTSSRTSHGFSEMFHRISGELQCMAAKSLEMGLTALKNKIERRIPEIIDSVVDRVVQPNGYHPAERNGNHRDYGARAPV